MGLGVNRFNIKNSLTTTKVGKVFKCEKVKSILQELSKNTSASVKAINLKDNPYWGKIIDYLRSNVFKEAAIERARIDLQEELSELLRASDCPLDTGKAKKLTDKKFYELYNPKLPTLLVFSPIGAEGTALMACAAQRQRIEGKKSLNVVFVPANVQGAAEYAQYDRGNWSLRAKEGFLIDSEGVIYEGKFPEIVNADIFEQSSAPSNVEAESINKNIRSITPRSAHLILEDKVLMKEALRHTNNKFPESLSFVSFREHNKGDVVIKDNTVLLNDSIVVPNSKQEKALSYIGYGMTRPSIKEFLEKYKGQGMVIKPSAESGGRGVLMVKRPTVAKLTASVSKLLDSYQRVMIEPWIKSFPLYDEKGKKLDWNFRVLVGKYGVIDIEVRVQSWGEPVNECKGAKVWEVKDLYDKLSTQHGDKLPSYEDFIGMIEKNALQAAQALDSGFLGIDYIYTEEGDLVCNEINAGRAGGIVSLAQIRKDFEDRLKAAKNYINPLLKLIKEKKRINHNEQVQRLKEVVDFNIEEEESLSRVLYSVVSTSKNIYDKQHLRACLSTLNLLKDPSIELPRMKVAILTKIAGSLALNYYSKEANAVIKELYKMNPAMKKDLILKAFRSALKGRKYISERRISTFFQGLHNYIDKIGEQALLAIGYKNAKGARRLITKMQEMGKDHPFTKYVEQIYTLKIEKDPQKVIEASKNNLEKDPYNKLAYYSLALAYREIADHQEAAKAFSKFLNAEFRNVSDRYIDFYRAEILYGDTLIRLGHKDGQGIILRMLSKMPNILSLVKAEDIIKFADRTLMLINIVSSVVDVRKDYGIDLKTRDEFLQEENT